MPGFGLGVGYRNNNISETDYDEIRLPSPFTAENYLWPLDHEFKNVGKTLTVIYIFTIFWQSFWNFRNSLSVEAVSVQKFKLVSAINYSVAVTKYRFCINYKESWTPKMITEIALKWNSLVLQCSYASRSCRGSAKLWTWPWDYKKISCSSQLTMKF